MKKKSQSTRKSYGSLICWFTGKHEWSVWRRNSKHTLSSRWCKRCPKVQRQTLVTIAVDAQKTL